MSRPWMPLYVADYLADTGHLSTLEHGAYMLLIMHYWSTGGLPDDDKRLASIARALPQQWADMRSTLAEFFGDGWKHERIDAELENAARAYERRAAAGKAGGKAKAGKASIATALPEQSHSQPQKITVASATDAGASPDWRDQLWRAGLYSLIRQTGKTEQAARQIIGKWSKAVGDDCRRVLLAIEQAETDRIGDPVSWITAALKPPDKPSRKRNYMDVATDKFSGQANGSESIFGSHGDAQRIPPRLIESRPDDAHLRGGIGGRFRPSDH